MNTEDEQKITKKIQELAEVLAIKDLRGQTRGQCDVVDPDSLIGQQYSRLMFTLRDAWVEMLTNEINKV